MHQAQKNQQASREFARLRWDLNDLIGKIVRNAVGEISEKEKVESIQLSPGNELAHFIITFQHIKARECFWKAMLKIGKFSFTDHMGFIGRMRVWKANGRPLTLEDIKYLNEELPGDRDRAAINAELDALQEKFQTYFKTSWVDTLSAGKLLSRLKTELQL